MSPTLLLCLALVGAPPASAPPPVWQMRLQTHVVQATRAFDGELALVVQRLDDDSRYTYNGATPSYLASGIKIFVLIALYEARAAGRLSFAEKLLFDEADLRDGAHLLGPARVGERLAIAQLMGWMMQHSDNAATDLLIKRVGLDAVNRAARRYAGVRQVRITSMLQVRQQAFALMDADAARLTPRQIFAVRRAGGIKARARTLAGLLGRTAASLDKRQFWKGFDGFYASGANSLPLVAVARVLAALHRGQVVDAQASREMLELMRGCKTGVRRIRAGLPRGVRLAHKTGTQLGRMCDLGLILPEDGVPLVLVACVKNHPSVASAEKLVARVSRAAYDVVQSSPPWRVDGPPEESDAGVAGGDGGP